MVGVVPISCSVICFCGHSLLLCCILLFFIGRHLGSSLFLGSTFVIDKYFILQFLFMSLGVPAHRFVMGLRLFWALFQEICCFNRVLLWYFGFPFLGWVVWSIWRDLVGVLGPFLNSLFRMSGVTRLVGMYGGRIRQVCSE